MRSLAVAGLALMACSDAAGPRSAPVPEAAAARPPDAAPVLPPAVPFPDAPELAALIPDGTVVRHEEAWQTIDGGVLHRVQVTLRPSDMVATLARLQQGAAALRLEPRADLRPVLTFVDESLSRDDVRIVHGQQIGAWGDGADGRARLFAVDPKVDGRTVEVVVGIGASADGQVERFARSHPAVKAHAALLEVAGALTDVTYRLEPARLELRGTRLVSGREAAAVAKVLDEVRGADFIEEDAARLGKIVAPHVAAWTKRLTGALRKAGFRRETGSKDGYQAHHRPPDAWFLVLDDTWQLAIGAER